VLLLTVFVVLFPTITNSVAANSRLNRKSFYEYQATDTKVTSAQVAKMFYNNEFASACASSQKYSDERLCSSSKELLKTILGDNGELYNYYAEFCENPPYYYGVDNYLAVIENRPVALNFIIVEFSLDTRILQLFFEEKTNTLIYFQHNIYKDEIYGEFDEINPIGRQIIDSTLTTLKDYYEVSLGLSPEKHASSSVSDSVIGFGLLQYSEAPAVEFN